MSVQRDNLPPPPPPPSCDNQNGFAGLGFLQQLQQHQQQHMQPHEYHQSDPDLPPPPPVPESTSSLGVKLPMEHLPPSPPPPPPIEQHISGPPAPPPPPPPPPINFNFVNGNITNGDHRVSLSFLLFSHCDFKQANLNNSPKLDLLRSPPCHLLPSQFFLRSR